MMLCEQAIRFIVHGRPQQRGSKQALLIPKRGGGFVSKNGRPIVVARDANRNSKEWMGQVRDAAAAVFRGELLRGPVRLRVGFYFKRPKAHYRTGKKANLLRDDAPCFHTSTPDLDKLVRAVKDSLSGVVYADDRQVAACESGKFWTSGLEHAVVVLEPLDDKQSLDFLTTPSPSKEPPHDRDRSQTQEDCEVRR
jgi:Holliday junction resolvase RusA-like endonuclease